MERLSMSHPRSHVMITGGACMTSLTAEIEAGEVAIIKYLASCYRRAFEECKKWKVCSFISLYFSQFFIWSYKQIVNQADLNVFDKQEKKAGHC